MNYLVDTNVLSELRKRPGKIDENVRVWADQLELSSAFMSVISAMEIELGVALVERRDAAQGALLRHWYESTVLKSFDGRILPMSLDVARTAVQMHVPNPQPDRDAYIAATAKVYSLTVVTRNVRDFKQTGVHLFNPWQATDG